MTKIDIISGFLGAGKTTLIKKILDEKKADEVVCIIENEFGDIGIDGDLLKPSGIEVLEIYSGCICCTLMGSFERSLDELMEKYHPDRIIIEPTGIAKLTDVLRACESALEREDVTMGMCLVVVNATNFDRYMKGWPEFFINQIEGAKTVVLSRSQNAAAEEVATVVNAIGGINGRANIITTPWEQMDAKTIILAAENGTNASLEQELLQEMEEETCSGCKGHHAPASCGCGGQHDNGRCHEDDHTDCGHGEEHHDCAHEQEPSCGCNGHEVGCNHTHDHDHSADEVFEVWSVESPKKFSMQVIQNALYELAESAYGIVLRAKGIVETADAGWIQFDYVPGEIGVQEFSADYTGRICVIGEKLDKQAIAKLFEM